MAASTRAVLGAFVFVATLAFSASAIPQPPPCADGPACFAAGEKVRKAAKKLRLGLEPGPKAEQTARRAQDGCETKGRAEDCLTLSWCLRLGIGV